MSTFFIVLSLVLVSLSLSSFALPCSQSFLKVTEILSNPSYLSMALTLQLISETIALNCSTATVFAPSDTAFTQLGQPSLFLLQYHISPLRLSIENLKALPFGAMIPTLQSNHSLIITSSVLHDGLSINDVKINELAIFDDGFVVMYGMDEFFNSSFQISQNLAPRPTTEPISPAALGQEPSSFGVDSLASVSNFLRSRGYLKMATFLDLQLVEFTDDRKVTIFAPDDAAINENVRNFSDYALIFRGHVVPSLQRWIDLSRADDETMFPTFSEGFSISVARSGDVLVLNGVPVIFPDMYNSDWVIIHGLNELLTSPAKHKFMGDSFSELDGSDEGNSPDYGEYLGG
ncbi:hypothetical protein L1049_001929 [Liquidambar formosana]|uniref:FAS1 domain-containing protein n=1 Tax=Liquidambar formosana TaxID=63359 RepID=A0AAP0NF15_LIQFO